MNLLVADFGCKVVPNVPLAKLVRHLAFPLARASTTESLGTYEKRDVVAHHKLNNIRQRRALREVEQVFQAERQVDMLVQLNAYTVRHFVIIVVF